MKGCAGCVAVALMMVAVVVVVVPSAAAQGLSPSQCTNQKNNLKFTCRNVVLGGQPSEGCCQLVRAGNADCLCQFVTPKLVAALGGAARAIGLVRSCGRTIPRNFKCGSLTTPP